jgi:hypothetical protein
MIGEINAGLRALGIKEPALLCLDLECSVDELSAKVQSWRRFHKTDACKSISGL